MQADVEPARRYMMPDRGDAKVWRYMNFASLASILQTKTLFFSRVTTLADAYEGIMPASLRGHFSDPAREFVDDDTKTVDFLEAATASSCVSCWHVNEDESAAMWKLYSFDFGVAIQSTVVGLIVALADSARSAKVEMALVQYIDFESPDLPRLPFPAFLKRKSFSHENELRVVTINRDLANNPTGVAIAVTDFSKLIERIYISPSAPTWFADVVRREIATYGLTIEVRHSLLVSRQLK